MALTVAGMRIPINRDAKTGHKELYLESILSRENRRGFALMGNYADVDITAMAIRPKQIQEQAGHFKGLIQGAYEAVQAAAGGRGYVSQATPTAKVLLRLYWLYAEWECLLMTPALLKTEIRLTIF